MIFRQPSGSVDKARTLTRNSSTNDLVPCARRVHPSVLDSPSGQVRLLNDITRKLVEIEAPPQSNYPRVIRSQEVQAPIVSSWLEAQLQSDAVLVRCTSKMFVGTTRTKVLMSHVLLHGI